MVTVLFSLLYILNCRVVEPMVVKTVSKTIVSAENERFPLEKPVIFLHPELNITIETAVK